MKLILNGDDFGISRSVNYAMIDCFQKGVMTSCSLMSNMGAVKHAAELMKENPKLSVGIHLNLTVGYPMTKNKTLIKQDGSFNKGMLNDSSHVDMEEIRKECLAQIERFIEVTGKLPDHINSHHGIEMIRGGEQVINELSKKYDLPIRRYFTLLKGNHKEIDYVIPNMKIAEAFNNDFSSNFTTVDSLIHLYSQEDIESDQIFEFAAHPGYVDYEIYRISSLTEGRAHDAYVFMSEEVKQWIKDNSIELISYRDIPKKK